jgi:hypothetical protein
MDRPAAQGWIGSWSPGIGDPTVLGWVTVLAYAAAFALSVVVSHRALEKSEAPERWFWRALAVGLLVLGINKQLDLQSAFTELGRAWAYRSGVYEQRREYQLVFLVLVGICGVIAAIWGALLLRRASNASRVAGAGAVGLICFVVMRAASFHHIDLFLKRDDVGVRWNGIFELGSLLVIGLAAAQRLQWIPSLLPGTPDRRVRSTRGPLAGRGEKAAPARSRSPH